MRRAFFFMGLVIGIFLLSFVSAECDYVGSYNATHYCGVGNILNQKIAEGAQCQNDYECAVGSCNEGICQTRYQEVREHTNWLEGIVALFENLFQGSECEVGEWQICGTDEGVCSLGIQECQTSSLTWGQCTSGEGYNYVSSGQEVCNDELDNDCDGTSDCEDLADCRLKPYCSNEEDGGDCINGEPCGPLNDTGICQIGYKLCNANGELLACIDAVDPSSEQCNGLDDDCNGELNYNENETINSTGSEICDNLIDDDCDGLVDIEDTDNCDACYGNDSADDEFCSDFGADEAACIGAEECEWRGEVTIFCGDDVVDEVLGEQCDGANFNSMICSTFNSSFTGGELSCISPGEENGCMFDTTYCTVTYEDLENNLTITGLQFGSQVTTAALADLPSNVNITESSNFLGGYAIEVSPQPLGEAGIFFKTNKTEVGEAEDVGLYRIGDNNELFSLITTYLNEEAAYYNHKALTDHFSDFLILEKEPVCGDDIVDGSDGEECDGSNLNGQTCGSLDVGFNAGELACVAQGEPSECTFDINDCYFDAGDGGDDNDGNGNGGGGGTGGGNGNGNEGESISIMVYSPRAEITYGKLSLPLEAIDRKANAQRWEYSLNSGPRISFTPNTTIDVSLGTNVLKVYARTSINSSYEAHKIVRFTVVENTGGTCGDLVCGEGESCSVCSSDCGSCAYLEDYCGNGVCEPGETSDNCALDCPKSEGGSKSVLLAFIILILLAGIGYMVYYIYSKKKMRPGTKPIYKPNSQKNYRPNTQNTSFKRR